MPPYGGSIAQNVYYANSDLCDPNVDTRGGYPSRETDSTGKMAPWPSPYILMVDRGACTFVKKVRCLIRVLVHEISDRKKMTDYQMPLLGCLFCRFETHSAPVLPV